MDEDKKESNEIDWLGVDTVMVFTTAGVGDLLFILILPHYLAGALVVFILWPKIKGLLASIVLLIAFLIPGPLLLIGAFLSIFLSNKLLAFLAEQVAIQAAAIATAGVGETLEVGALAAEGTEMAATAAEAVEAGAAAAEAGEAAATGAEVAEAGAGAAGAGGAAAEAGEAAEGAEAAGEVEPEALGQERELLGEEGQLRQELLEETPGEEGFPEETEAEEPEEKKPQETEADKKAREIKERAEKIKEWMDRLRPKEEGGEGKEDEGDEGDEEDMEPAA